MNKLCPGCKTDKPLDEFHRNSKAKDGRLDQCKPCHRTRMKAAIRRYTKKHPGYQTVGFGFASRYQALLEAQGGLCALCAKPPREDDPLCVDHDHNGPCGCSGPRSCGECVRGLLHKVCNLNVGRFENGLALSAANHALAGAYLARYDAKRLKVAA